MGRRGQQYGNVRPGIDMGATSASVKSERTNLWSAIRRAWLACLIASAASGVLMSVGDSCDSGDSIDSLPKLQPTREARTLQRAKGRYWGQRGWSGTVRTV